MKAVVFGAGEIGVKVRKIFEEEGMEVACFFDNSEKKWGKEFDGLIVNSPQDLHDIEYDVLGIGALKAAETIKGQLIEKGVDPSAIRIPIGCNKISHNETVLPEEAYYLDRTPDQPLSKRIDIVLRYLLLKGVLYHNEYDNNVMELFKNCFADQDNVESLMSDKLHSILNDKVPLRNRDKNYLKAIKEIAEDDDSWASVYSESNLIEGSLDKVTDYVQDEHMKITLLNAYLDLSQSLSLVFVSGNAVDSDKIPSVLDVTLNFESNYVAYLSFKRIVNSQFRQKSYVPDKDEVKELLKHKELGVKVLLVESSDFSIEDKNIVVINTADELTYVRNSILNTQSIDFINKRLPTCEEDRFFDMLDEMKGKMEEFNVPLGKVCIVGSGTLQAYGMRTATDIDLIITDDLRELYGNGLVIVSDNVEIHHADEFDISDHDIITDPSNHFNYYGLKFMNLDILYRKRKATGSSDARLIELHQAYIDKKAIA